MQLEAAIPRKNLTVGWLAALHQRSREAETLARHAEGRGKALNASADIYRARKEQQTTADVQIRRARNHAFEVPNS